MLGASGFSPCLHNDCFFFFPSFFLSRAAGRNWKDSFRQKVLAAHSGKALTGFCWCVCGAIHEPGNDDLEGDLTMHVSFGERVNYCKSSYIRNETNRFQHIIAWQSLLIVG